MLNYLVVLILLLLSAIQSGCVGTIQDNETLLTDSSIPKKGKLAFQGISHVTATAHNRIRVSFFPATGGSGQFSYLVYANGNFALPVASLSNASAALDSLGKFNIDVKNLNLNTSYTFSVRVYDVGNDEADSNTVALTVRTLSEMVPIFDGAISLGNLPGVDGLTNLKITWNVATAAYVDNSGFGNNSHNISGYNIYAGESEASMALVASVNDAAAKSFVVPNLISGRNYYAMVRAKNSATPPVEDLNMTILSRKTLIAQPIQFSGVKSLAIPKTIEGFSTINVDWEAGTGTFDRYKVMVFNSNPGTVVPGVSTPDQTFVVNDLTSVSKIITVPTPNSTYYVAVLACAGDACTTYGGASVIKNIKTTPPVAPFNGIKSIVAQDLHSIQINWDRPDTTQGVYSTVKIFKSDVGGVYNETIDEISTVAGATGLLIDSSTDTSVVLKNLSVDTEYCFVAMDYDTFYLTDEYPFGRSATLRVKACITLRYIAPGFLGVNSNCTTPTSSGFTVAWNTPLPFGVFDHYEIYVRDGNSGFNFLDALSGDSSYYKLPPIPKSATSYVFNQNSPLQLAADSYYQVGIKTFYNDSGIFRRDTNNSFTMNCKTSAANVEHKGWAEILALGPKVHGLKAASNSGIVTPSEIVAERLKPLGVPVDGFNEVRDLEYAQEWPTGSLGIDSSDQGIVKLIWNDFDLTNGMGKLFDYASSHVNSVVEYKVYRKAHASKYDTTYKIKAKITDTDWGAPINETTIVPQMTTLPNGSSFYFAEFIDYTLTHPYNSDPTKINQGTIYYYKVEAFINGTRVNFQNTYLDAVVRVVLPPANMAFAHRWMVNKQMCGEIGKTIEGGDVDRDNDYKCLYNGLGAVFDSIAGSHYYDMNGDLLIDRFKMGCNFSRGGTANECSDVSYTNVASKIFFEGNSSIPAKDRKIGDCIGYGGVNTGTSPTGKIKAIPGSVFYDRSRQACYVNTTIPASLDGNGKGSTWQTLKAIDPSDNTLENLSKILPSALSSVGMGWGQKIYANNAYLPTLIGGSQNNLYRTCQSNTVSINGINHRKRLLRRKEEIATFAMSSFITQSSSTSTAQKISAGTFMSGVNDRDCHSSSNASFMYPLSATAAAANEMDLTKWNYTNAYTDSSNYVSYKQLFVTGSAGNKSTEMCFSLFGLQDISGNGSEVLSDRFWCNGTTTKDMCSSGLKDKNAITAIAVPEANLAPAQIYTPEIDPLNKYNLMSANGQYLNFTNSTIAEGNGVHLLTTPGNSNYAVVGTPANYRYFNPILGVMLSCSGSSCLIEGSYDDNTLVTTKASSSVASILNYPYIGGTWSASTTNGTIMPIILNGYSGDTTNNGRHAFSVRGYFDGNIDATGRCTTLVEDYNEQSTQYNH